MSTNVKSADDIVSSHFSRNVWPQIVPLGLLVLLCLWTPGAAAQENSGALQGTVSDGTDAVLPGVTVTLTNEATNRVFSTTAGAYGNYSLRKVDPGRYTVTFEYSG